MPVFCALEQAGVIDGPILVRYLRLTNPSRWPYQVMDADILASK